MTTSAAIADAGRALVHVTAPWRSMAAVRRARPARPGAPLARWHQAWSRAYVSRKYGLPDPTGAMLAKNGIKALLAALAFRRSGWERYGGSVAAPGRPARGAPAGAGGLTETPPQEAAPW